MDDLEFKSLLNEKVEYIEGHVKANLPLKEGFAQTVMEAMEYSVMAGGKRLRPMLILESYCMFGGDSKALPDYVSKFMAAIEMIHTYSLVHDDLPAMDNDEYRRGRLTTWKVYGDGLGVLAGDALLNYAFELMLDACMLDSKCALAAKILANKAGIYGMIGGQCADIEAEGKSDVSQDTLLYIHEHKTACLIEASLMVGAALAGADDSMISKMEEVGSNVGIAFQIQDDILDVIGTQEELGKPIGSDEENAKVTYVTLNGLEKSQEEVKRLSTNAMKILSEVSGEHEFLDKLIISLIDRRN